MWKRRRSCRASSIKKDFQDFVPAGKTGRLEYYNKLQPGIVVGGPKLMWIKRGVDLSKYKKVMADYVFSFADNSESPGANGIHSIYALWIFYVFNFLMTEIFLSTREQVGRYLNWLILLDSNERFQ